jgi:hypothetical protein
MRFNELQSRSAENDKVGTWELDDTRRPRLKLKDINKMRKKKELAKVEYEKEKEYYSTMYGRGSEE